MFFWLKKLIGYWITPLPFSILLLVAALLLLRSQRRARAGRILVVLAALVLLITGCKGFSIWLVRPLEVGYAAIPEVRTPADVPAGLAACRYVVVLGGGNGATPGVSALNRLSIPARARLTEGVRIMRFLPEANLLVSGPAVRGSPTHATVLEQAALSLGIGPGRIQRIEHARDTEDEANAVRQIAGDAPVAVVTSAWHMPRSMALFRSAGVRAVACPTDYTSHDDGRFHWRDLFWDTESLARTTLGIRERAGYLWIWMRGKA